MVANDFVDLPFLDSAEKLKSKNLLCCQDGNDRKKERPWKTFDEHFQGQNHCFAMWVKISRFSLT